MLLPSTTLSSLQSAQGAYAFCQKARKEISKILFQEENRILLILGPCSIHNTEEALEYAEHLQSLQKEIGDLFFLVMRSYVEKPRSGIGWCGFLVDPHLDQSYAIEEGLEKTRSLLEQLLLMQIPTSSEFLFPQLAKYYQDLICWGSIGARTHLSAIHRSLASSLSFPIGIKNGLEGDLSSVINSLYAISQPLPWIEEQNHRIICKKTAGNREAHLVLRGHLQGPNFDQNTIKKASLLLEKYSLASKIVIDCSHQNSRKNPLQQIEVFQKVIEQIKEERAQQKRHIVGIMLESFLEFGNQPIDPSLKPHSLKKGISITDACLDWKSTKELILQAAERLFAKT